MKEIKGISNKKSYIDSKNLDSLLKPEPIYRLKKKDINRRTGIPFEITSGTRITESDIQYSSDTLTEAQILAEVATFPGFDQTKVIGLPFLANASAGEYVATLPLNLDSVPLSLVWFVGSIDNGAPRAVDKTGGLLHANYHLGTSSTVTDGVDVFSGATAAYECTKDNLIIQITSTNVGWANTIMAYFRYALYYDDSGVQGLGL